jgi:aspartate aminotransferase-like enzyme
LLLFTASPTDLPPEVRKALGKQMIHPDLDPEFLSLYDGVVKKVKKITGTRNDLFVMAGEGMLVLDSAVANLVEKGDQVLTISSGFYGDGLKEFVENYGGRPVALRSADGDTVSASEVDRSLEKNPGVKVATFVHTETPCGTMGPIDEIGKVCNDHGAILIGDTITSLGGVSIAADRNHVDVTLGASQKCFSAPPGLATISVSKRAWEKIEGRKHKVTSFYLDLMPWKQLWLEKKVFPYAPSVSDIYALDAGLDLILEEGIEHAYRRHAKVAELVRSSCELMGLKLFAKSREISAQTVTSVKVPKGIDEKKLRAKMVKDYGVMISESWGKPAGKVVLLGHMGYGAHRKKANKALAALDGTLKTMGYARSKL